MNKKESLKFYSSKNLMSNYEICRNGTNVPTGGQQLSVKRMSKFGTLNSVLKLNKMVIYLLLLLVSLRSLEARYISYKNFETFCRNFPLHMACMGAFAGGGKRSFDMDSIPVDDYRSNDQNKMSLIESILSDIDTHKLNKSLDKKDSKFFKTKPFEYDYESRQIDSSSDEYEDQLTLKRKVLILKLLNKLTEKYEKEKNNYF